MTDRLDLPGLYVHLPFCSKICPYCDFYVLTGDRQRYQRFLQYLSAEIGLSRELPWPTFVDEVPSSPFDTLYLGGGTPSILAPEKLLELRDRLTSELPFTSDPWIGLEANPEDVTDENLTAWEELGVRFLSLGIQSFGKENLAFLGRVHEPRDCQQSVHRIRERDFDTLSLDLIFGLPHQTKEDWRRDLETAIELRPDHLSCYQLTIELGTPFGFRRQQGRLEEMDRGEQADLFLLTHRLLADHGFEAYEVSNFSAAAQHRSLHNRKYWNRTPYLGIGPSAHSFASQHRWWNARKIRPYEASIDEGRRPIQDHEELTPEQIRLEHLMLGLRTPEGVDFTRFPDGSGPHIRQINGELLEDLVEKNFANVVGERLVPTLQGLAIAEAIATRFRLGDTESPEPSGIC